MCSLIGKPNSEATCIQLCVERCTHNMQMIDRPAFDDHGSHNRVDQLDINDQCAQYKIVSSTVLYISSVFQVGP